MALFNRQSNQTHVPAEIQEYYQTERRERAGVAWLLALGTLLVTVVLAAGLFFGGRMAYRSIVGDDAKKDNSSLDTKNKDTKKKEDPVASNDRETDRQAAAAEEQAKTEAAKRREAEQKKQDAAEKEAARLEAKNAKSKTEAAKKREQKHQAAAARERQEAEVHQNHDDQHVAAANDSIPSTGPEHVLAVAGIIAIAGYFLHRIIGNALAAKRHM